jgi:PH domain
VTETAMKAAGIEADVAVPLYAADSGILHTRTSSAGLVGPGRTASHGRTGSASIAADNTVQFSGLEHHDTKTASDTLELLSINRSRSQKFLVDPESKREGWLMKLTHNGKTWQKRYMCCVRDSLHYFKEKPTNRAIGDKKTIHMGGATVRYVFDLVLHV